MTADLPSDLQAEVQQPAYARHTRNLLGGLLILAITATIILGRDFLVPVIFAFFISLTFRPIIRRLSRRGIPAWLSTSGIAVVLVIIVLALLLVFGTATVEWIGRWPDIQRTFLQQNASLLDWLNCILDLTQDITTSAAQGSTESAEVVVREPVLPAIATFIAAYPLNVSITLTSALVIALFMMASGDLFYEKLIRIMPRLVDKKNALRIVFDVEREVSNYLLTITAINAGLALAVGAVFWYLGMPMPVFWGILAFGLNFVPYLGPIAGVIAAAFVAIVTFGSMGQAVVPPIAYIILIGIESQVATPAVLSRRMSINSVAILISLAFWGWAWGIAGIVMAVPFLVTLRVFCGHLPLLMPVGEFLAAQGDGPLEKSGKGSGLTGT